MKHWRLFLIVLIVGIGAGLYLHGRSFPVYTDMNGPYALETKLADTPAESRTQRWYKELEKIETPHKRYTDLGRGLMAVAVGLGLAWALAWKYERKSPDEKWRYLQLAWFGLWVLRLPLIVFYYEVRQSRHDYPWWGDTIMIPIASEWMTTAAGWAMSWVLLYGLLAGYSLPEKIGWRRPRGVWGHVRFVLVALWMILLADLVWLGLEDGDLSTIIACLGAVPLLLAVLWAVPKATDAARLEEGAEGPKPLATTAGGV